MTKIYVALIEHNRLLDIASYDYSERECVLSSVKAMYKSYTSYELSSRTAECIENDPMMETHIDLGHGAIHVYVDV